MVASQKSWFLRLLECALPEGAIVERTEISIARRTLLAEVQMPDGRPCTDRIREDVRAVFSANEVGIVPRGTATAFQIQGFSLPLTTDQ